MPGKSANLAKNNEDTGSQQWGPVLFWRQIMYRFQEFYIPDRMMPSIKRYVEEKKPPGGFLTAVIQNDLSGACSKADDENMRNLQAYVAYFYNEVISECWGSKEKMEAWLKSGNDAQPEE